MADITSEDFLRIGSRIRVLPIIHGSGDFAIKVREELLSKPYDCVAVPLPPSFQEDVEAAIEQLPTISVVAQLDVDTDNDEDNPDDNATGFSYVPIDPCQGVIAALRLAMGERMHRAFIDMETPRFEASSWVFPDAYALKKVSPEAFAAAVLPVLPAPKSGQHLRRITWMARRLRELERRYTTILLVCSLADWPWIRDAYQRQIEVEEPTSFFAPMLTMGVDPRTLVFLLGELPFLTGLYERGRRELTDDENLSVDGVKEMVLRARDILRERLPKVADRITPQLLSVYFRYVRNLSLIERRLTPDLYSLVIAAQQTAGDDLAIAIGEAAREYPYSDVGEFDSSLRMGLGRAEVPAWGTAKMVSRLPGQALEWRSCQLRTRPKERDKKEWRQKWDPYGMCSWPPEDDRIESFQRHVRDQARAILGADLARSEKFTSSVMDGLDIRETLRNWHTGDLYVKILPPSRGTIEIVVFLFDTPADPQVYTNRTTWYAEHAEESTLAFFGTDAMKNMIGPGIAQAEYGGAMFLFPPRSIPDIWEDNRLDFADTLEDRLLAAAFLHSRERHVAVVCPKPPSIAWRRLAKKFGKKIVHIPLGRFGGQLVERLRRFHVLNGKQVRSYAADFIRDL
jgi:hypothetical protein